MTVNVSAAMMAETRLALALGAQLGAFDHLLAVRFFPVAEMPS